MPNYIAHVNTSITLRLSVTGWDEDDAAANAETLAIAIIKSQFSTDEVHASEVVCDELTCVEPDGPQG